MTRHQKGCATRKFHVAHSDAIGRAPLQLAPKGERMWRIGAPLILPYRRGLAQPAASGTPPLRAERKKVEVRAA